MSVYTASLIYSSIKGAPYVPTWDRLKEEIFYPARIKKGKYMIELGSGDGRMIRFAVKKYKVRGLGVDINPLLVFWSRMIARAENVLGVEFKVQDITKVDLTKADYLYIFLMPELVDKIIPKMKSELKKGSVIISHGFRIKALNKNLYFTKKRSPFPTYYYRV
jgi:hypothetical protein